MSWRFAYASVIGTSHLKANQPCQDASQCVNLKTDTGHDVLVAVIADGAGSAERGLDGAVLACDLWTSELAGLLQAGGDLNAVTSEFIHEWRTRFVREVSIRAEAAGLRNRDYACTFLTAILGVNRAIFAQVGDGAIVVEDRELPNEFCYMFWPQKGEFENQTYFLTDDTGPLIEYAAQPAVDAVVLFSDGLQRLALHYQSKTAYTPFFRSVLGPVRASEQGGHLVHLSAELCAMLSSDRINDRTDDDKTLLIATRNNYPAPMGGTDHEATV